MSAPAAQATLSFVRNALRPVVWVANDNGSKVRRLAAGTEPQVSPDGRTIAFLRMGRGFRPDMMVAPADGSSPPRRLFAGWRVPFSFAWSPDSATIAAVRGPEIGRQRLVLIDVAGGAQRTVARGFVNGLSFSPDGTRLVYSLAAKDNFPPRSDLYVTGVGGGPRTRITRDHRSLSPLWGPDTIVFAKQLGAGQRRYGPKNELFLIQPDGRGARRLTHTRVDPLLQGLTPTDWSADGSRLLAEFGGQDTSYAVALNPRTGAQRPLTRNFETGFTGAALSADGQFILGATGGFEPGPGHNVVSVPYSGGRGRVLARNAFEPDWSR
ncbi:MAG TPA: hypothetical protein VF176_03395 [Solirubrobacterales bacterium]